MTPAETFAQSRTKAENLIRQYAPARLQDAVIERLSPAIILRSKASYHLNHDPKIPIGTSKFGGAPDVPDGFEWPMTDPSQHKYGRNWSNEDAELMPLEFLAQINLHEMASYDVDKVLPNTGLLLFFFETNPRAWRVIHAEGTLTRAKPPQVWDVDEPRVTTIAAHYVWSVPLFAYWSDELQDDIWEWDREEAQRWGQIAKRLDPFLWPHSMLGNPQQVRSARGVEARVRAAYDTQRGKPEDWKLLLQIGEDPCFNYVNDEYLYLFYLIHRDDLAARDFSRCHVIYERQF